MTGECGPFFFLFTLIHPDFLLHRKRITGSARSLSVVMGPMLSGPVPVPKVVASAAAGSSDDIVGILVYHELKAASELADGSPVSTSKKSYARAVVQTKTAVVVIKAWEGNATDLVRLLSHSIISGVIIPFTGCPGF